MRRLEPLTTHGVRRRPLPRLALGAGAAALLAGATAYVLVRIAGTEEVARVLSQLDPRVLVLVVVLQLASSAALTQVYRATFAANGGSLHYRDALTVALGAFSLTQLLPAGGAAGGLFAMRRLRTHGADAVRATTTVLLVGLITMGTLGVAISLATAVTAVRTPAYLAYAVTSAAVTALVVGGFVLLHRFTRDGAARRHLAARLDRLQWRGRLVGRSWAQGLEQHVGLLQAPSALLRPVAWSAVNWSVDVAVFGLLLRAAGADVPFLAVLVAFAVGNLLNAIPLTPGGIGVVEAGVAGTLLGFGADPAATSVAVIGYRAVAFWLPVLIAAPVVATGLRPSPTPVVEVAA